METTAALFPVLRSREAAAAFFGARAGAGSCVAQAVSLAFAIRKDAPAARSAHRMGLAAWALA